MSSSLRTGESTFPGFNSHEVEEKLTPVLLKRIRTIVVVSMAS